jgi:hypothetical protein
MAEVSVKITASNQTQTGFQSVLADAQKTAAQVQQTMSRASSGGGGFRPIPQSQKPMGDFSKEIADLANASNDGTKAAAEEMLAELRRAREEAKTTASEIENIPAKGGGLIGRLLGAAGLGAGIGLAVKQQIEQVAQEYNKLIDLNSALDSSFQAISSATTFDGIISGAKQAQEQIANIAKETENFKSGLFNNAANFFTGGKIFDNLDQLKEDAEKTRALQIVESFKRQNAELTEQISGAKEGRLDQVERGQETKRQRAELESMFRAGNFSPEQIAIGLQAFDRNRNLQQEKQFAQEDFAARQKLEERQRREEQKNRQKLSPGTRLGDVVGKELGPGNIQGINNFQREQMRQAEEAARTVIANSAGGSSFQGGMTASSLQRIGFASSEFRDTRTKEDPAKSIPKISDLVKEILQQLKNGEPLVLGATK